MLVMKQIGDIKNYNVGVILPSEGMRFFDDILDAMRPLAEKYKPLGLNVIWKLMSGYDVEEHYNAIDELSTKVDALIINPINVAIIRKKLSQVIESGVFVVTLNNDVEDIGDHHYVGSNYFHGGQTAGALLKMINRNEECNIGVTLGSINVLGHQRRLNGFLSVLQDDPRFNLIDVREDNDDDECAYEKVTDMLNTFPNINALFMATSGGTYGACRAILSLRKEKDLTVITFDTIPAIVDMMRAGVIDATIYQHPHMQGQIAMQVVFEYLVEGVEPEEDSHIMKNDIRILQNI